MTWLSKPSPEEQARLFKVLTGGGDLSAADLPNLRITNTNVQQPPEENPPRFFSVGDKSLLGKLPLPKALREKRKIAVLEDLPSNGSVFCGKKSRGINNHIKRELKESGGIFDLKQVHKKAKVESAEVLENFEITR